MFRPQEGISPLLRRVAAVSDPPHWPLFRTDKESDPVLETAGVWPRRGLGTIPAPCRLGKHASEKHRWLTGLDIRQSNLSFDQIRHGVLSHGRSLGQCDGQLLFPVFLSGTNRSNSARRGEAWQNWFAQCD